MHEESAVLAVESFMNANYPCKCEDDEACPGNYYEAAEIVRMVRAIDATPTN